MKKTISIVIILAFAANAQIIKADFIFGTPTHLTQAVNTGYEDIDSSVSADGLSLYFNSNRSGGYGNWDIWVATRDAIDSEWSPAFNLGTPVNGPSDEASPRISADGLSLFFLSSRSGGYGNGDIWVATRATVSEPWSTPVNLGPTVNSSAHEGPGNMPADGLTLYLSSDRPGGSGRQDLWVAMRAATSEPWGEPVNLGPTVNSSAADGNPSVSADGLALFFKSDRAGGMGAHDLYVTTRASVSDPWGEPVNLGPGVNTPRGDELPSISADGSTLYFSSNRPGTEGNYDLWQVSICPVVDFNEDGVVDSIDMTALVDNWHTDNAFFDVAPLPLGDGYVDVQDLVGLAEHLFTYPGSLAHWKLDETEEAIAFDSAGTSDGLLLGNPIWMPEDGMVDGAIALDGVDDAIVISEPVLDPAEGPFSVLAWIKGGEPGQAIVSQQDGADWLAVDAPDGTLSTGLQAGRRGAPLVSETVVTDGHWHCVVFTWDGSTRSLYVDGSLAATDEQDNLQEQRFGGLHIGCGVNQAPGSFFSGLIDDVRIYNRVLRP